MSQKISAIILAAGASTRMEGGIKQLLPWENTTLLEHAISQAKSVFEEVYVVLGANADTITQNLILDAGLIQNPDWKSGLGSSIAAGVQHVINTDKKPTGILLMLADQPLIDPSFLNELKNSFISGDSNIVATSYNDKLGVPAIFRKSLFRELAELNQDFGARDIIKKHKEQSRSVDPHGKAVDIDTKEKYLQLIDKLNS